MTSPPKSDLEGTPSIRNRRANRLPCYWITPGEQTLCDYHTKICRIIQEQRYNKNNILYRPARFCRAGLKSCKHFEAIF